MTMSEQDKSITEAQRKRSISSSHKGSLYKHSWIERHVKRLECAKFIPRNNDPGRCGCGRTFEQHEIPDASAASPFSRSKKSSTRGYFPRWSQYAHTVELPTDAFGTLEFQAGPHPSKARYIRLASNSGPHCILNLLFNEWKLRIPNLVISVVGGYGDFMMQPKLKQVFQTGLIKAATTTGAWLVTNGLDRGVSKLVGDAIVQHTNQYGTQVIALGIAPWGVVYHREHLKGKDKVCAYHSVSSRLKQEIVLNKGHSHFLLADDGSIERFGAELYLRRNFEQFMAQQYIDMRKQGGTKSQVPIIAVLVEGGPQSFSNVRNLLTNTIPIPVVVCDGSGRAADILAFAYKFSDDKGQLPTEVKDQLTSLMIKTFELKKVVAEALYVEMAECMKHKSLINVYRMLSSGMDIDVTILTALLNVSSEKLSPGGQLTLTMAWNRPDLARSKVFKYDRIWKTEILENAMLDALVNNRLEFVKLLLENGVNMTTFLTTARLELLYSMPEIEENVKFLKHMKEVLDTKEPFSLRLVGRYIQELMGGGYHHPYCHRDNHSSLFLLQPKDKVSQMKKMMFGSSKLYTSTFRYPYTELMQWCVLTHRFDMASYMILSGEETIAKSLLAARLCKSIRKSFVKELALEQYNLMKRWHKKYESYAVELQEFCYKRNPAEAERLLTYELSHFSKHTCISLAYLCKSKSFLALPGTQAILSDLWYGGLQQCRLIDFKIIFSLVSGFTIVLWPMLAFLVWKYRFLQFKTKKELSAQPQTLEEHLSDLYDTTSSSSTDSEYSMSSKSGKDVTSNKSSRRSSVNESKDHRPCVAPSTKSHKGHERPTTFETSFSIDETAANQLVMEVSNNPPDMQLSILPRRHSCPDMMPFEEKDLHLQVLNQQGQEHTDTREDVSVVTPNSKSDSSYQSPVHEVTDPLFAPTSKESQFAAGKPQDTSRKRVNVQEPSQGRRGRRQTVGIFGKGLVEERHDFPEHARRPLRRHRISHQQERAMYLVSKEAEARRVTFDQKYRRPRKTTIKKLEVLTEYPGEECGQSERYFFHASASVPLFSTISPGDGNLPGAPSAMMGSIGLTEVKRPSSIFGESDAHRRAQDQLSVRKKIYEFFNAPITRYYIHLIFYMLFLACFIHVSSVFYDPNDIYPTEVAVHAYVYTYFLDKFREILIGSGNSLKGKVKNHFKNFWNIYDHLTCICTLFALTFRYICLERMDLYESTRAWTSCCCALWVIRFVELMKIWHFMGPTVYISGQMLKEMIPLLILLFLSIFAFGTMRQGMMLSRVNYNFTFNTVRDILMEPYCMLYGVIFPDTIDPANWNVTIPQTPFSFLVPSLMVIYMIIICFLHVSVLLARFNDVYSQVQQESEIVYRFVRHGFIIEYQAIPLLPPPLTIISWFYSLIRLIIRCFKYGGANPRRVMQYEGLKLFLPVEEIEKLHDFEEDSVERYFRNVRLKEMQAKDESLISVGTSISELSYYVGKIAVREYSNKISLLSRLMQFDTEMNTKHDVLRKEFRPQRYSADMSSKSDTPMKAVYHVESPRDKKRRGPKLYNTPWYSRGENKS